MAVGTALPAEDHLEPGAHVHPAKDELVGRRRDARALTERPRAEVRAELGPDLDPDLLNLARECQVAPNREVVADIWIVAPVGPRGLPRLATAAWRSPTRVQRNVLRALVLADGPQSRVRRAQQVRRTGVPGTILHQPRRRR